MNVGKKFVEGYGTIHFDLEVTARSDDDVIQGVQHRELPIHGVQFHPESIASEHGHALLKNFIDMTVEREAA